MQVISQTVPPKLSYLIDRSWFSTIQEKFLKLVESKFTICLKNGLMKYLKNYRYFSNASHWISWRDLPSSCIDHFTVENILGNLDGLRKLTSVREYHLYLSMWRNLYQLLRSYRHHSQLKQGKGFCRGELIPIKIAFFSGNLSVYGCL